jgi:fumarate reductase subunit C
MHTPATPRHEPAYHQRLPASWWLKNPRYFMYMVREFTAVFAALWVVVFLTQIPLMAGGPEAHSRWLATVRSPGWILFSLVSLAFVLYHAWTWFNVMGTTIYVRLGKKATPASTLIASIILVWVVVSVMIAYILVSPAIGG